MKKPVEMIEGSPSMCFRFHLMFVWGGSLLAQEGRLESDVRLGVGGGGVAVQRRLGVFILCLSIVWFGCSNNQACSSAVRKPAISLADSTELRSV